jgi:hypothetical protein
MGSFTNGQRADGTTNGQIYENGIANGQQNGQTNVLDMIVLGLNSGTSMVRDIARSAK